MWANRKWHIARLLRKKRRRKQNISNNREVVDNTDMSKFASSRLICRGGPKRKNNRRMSNESKDLNSSTTSKEVLCRKNSFRPLKKSSKKEWSVAYSPDIGWLIFQPSFLTVLTMTWTHLKSHLRLQALKHCKMRLGAQAPSSLNR